jgi:hypothetical protein
MKTESSKSRTLDVRPIIAEGGSPLEKILAATRGLGPQDNLLLITPFLPSPMIEKLQSEGFQARPERRSDGAWQTTFARKN